VGIPLLITQLDEVAADIGEAGRDIAAIGTAMFPSCNRLINIASAATKGES